MSPTVSNGVIWALSGAWRLAVEARAPSIGSHHLIVSLALRTPGARPVLGSALGAMRRELNSLNELGELGSGTGLDDTDLDLEAEATLREAQWRGIRSYATKALPAKPEWDREIRDAVHRALISAKTADLTWAGRTHLLDATLANPDSRASILLRKCRIDAPALLAGVREAPPTPMSDGPRTPIVDGLRAYGILSPVGRHKPRLFAHIAGAIVRHVSGTESLLYLLELEAVRQAVRLNHPRVTTGHLVLAALALDEQIALSRQALPGDLAKANRAGQVLARHGVTYLAAAAGLDSALDESAPPQRKRRWRSRTGDPGWTVGAVAAAEAARRTAAVRRTQAGTSDLLVAALAEREGPGARMVESLGGDPATIRAEVQREIV